MNHIDEWPWKKKKSFPWSRYNWHHNSSIKESFVKFFFPSFCRSVIKIIKEPVDLKNGLLEILRLRQGCRMEFLSHFFNFWDFSRPKSYHSNLPIAFIVDHLKPNGFQYHIDQARNCPFGLPDDRWHHVRLRHRLLRNRKKCKSFKQFSEKRMKLELIKIALH